MEIQPLIMENVDPMKDLLIRTESLEEENNRKEAEEDLNSIDKVQVVIGTEKWLLANGIKLDDKICQTLNNERLLGSISLLCAINGRNVFFFVVSF